MKENNSEIEKKVYEKFGFMLYNRDRKIEEQKKEIATKTKLLIEKDKERIAADKKRIANDKELIEKNREINDYKFYIKKLNKMEDLNTPEAKKIIQTLMKM